METAIINRNRRYVIDRRTGKDRRAISYHGYYPERRSINDRRFVYFRRYK
ncbi:MAG: hypothetical protein GY699_18170 [Desulfobacteraceae bacterium]|nr:hypothetical protein [Desulfobacteraceae bacterium]